MLAANSPIPINSVTIYSVFRRITLAPIVVWPVCIRDMGDYEKAKIEKEDGRRKDRSRSR